MTRLKCAMTGLAVWLMLSGCASAAPGAGPSASQPAHSGALAATPKRIVAAVMGDPPSVSGLFTAGAAVPGHNALEALANVGLTRVDKSGELNAQLVEAVPTVENGLWRLLPDGRMETRWKIRGNARWHDGPAFTSADVLFSSRVAQDRDLPVQRNVAYDSVEGIEAPDASTVLVRWHRPFIQADALFVEPLLPAHVLARSYAEDRLNLPQHPYWGPDFVGNGPFRLREWAKSSHASFTANDAYALGRPRLDEIEVRFIPDPNTLQANILANTVDVTVDKSISIEQAIQVRDQWKAGRVETTPFNWIVVHPQFLNPNPALVVDVQFRRALVHAVDRQELVDTLAAGLSSVAHTYLSPNAPEYREIEGRVPRYSYDVRRTSQLIETLGYTRGPDGTYVDSTGQRLAVEIRTTTTDLNQKSMFAVADFWRRAGVAADSLTIPAQRRQDAEWLATHPAFRILRQPNSPETIDRFYHSAQAPVPDNHFRGNNYNRHMNPAFDALQDRYLTTIPRAERTRALADIVHYIAENLVVLGLFYDVEATMIGNRLENVSVRYPTSTQTWNVELWDLKS